MNKSVEHYPTNVANLALMGTQQCLQYFGCQPDVLIRPYSAVQIKVLVASLDEWTILKCSFNGDIDNHYPKHPILIFLKEHPVTFPKVT